MALHNDILVRMRKRDLGFGTMVQHGRRGPLSLRRVGGLADGCGVQRSHLHGWSASLRGEYRVTAWNRFATSARLRKRKAGPTVTFSVHRDGLIVKTNWIRRLALTNFSKRKRGHSKPPFYTLHFFKTLNHPVSYPHYPDRTPPPGLRDPKKVPGLLRPHQTVRLSRSLVCRSSQTSRRKWPEPTLPPKTKTPGDAVFASFVGVVQFDADCERDCGVYSFGD